MVKRIAFVCMAALLIFWPGGLAAQQQGQIKGRVADTAGNPVPGMTVIVRNTVTGAEHDAKTDQNGEFLVAGLEPGKYCVQNQSGQTGSAPCETTVGSTNTNDVAVQQTTNGQLAITAETVVTDRSTAQIKSGFNSTQVELLPEPNEISRTGQFYGAYNLSLLSDGVTPGSILQTGVGPSVGGRPNTANNFLVIGTDNNNQAIPGPLVTVTNEATTDFAVVQGQQSAAFGHSTGGQMNLLAYQGANQWHGGVYDYLNNRKLNAREPSLGRIDQDLRYDQNRFGAKAGGPILKNSLFAFGDFEYIPLGLNRQLLTPVLAPTSAGFATASAIPGVSLTNLVALRNSVAVSQTPVATTTVNGVTVPLGFVDTGIPGFQNQYNGIVSLDWNMHGKSQLGVRYVHNDVSTNAFGSTLPAFQVPGFKRALLGAIDYTATPSPTLTYNVNVGYNRFDQKVGGGSFTFPGVNSLPGILAGDRAGENTVLPPTALTAFPNINIGGLGLVLGANVSADHTRANTYQGGASADWTSGSNHFRFGGDVRVLQSIFGNLSSASGNLAYSNLQRYLLDLPPDAGALRTFSPGSTSFSGNRTLAYLFVEDKIRFHGLDVELGLGYQYAQLPSSLRRQADLSGLSVPGLISFGEPNTDTLNFAPRVGVAWSPSAKRTTVFRGAFGMMYDAFYGNTSLLAPDMRIGTVTSSAASIPGFLASGGIPAPVTAQGSVGTFVFDQQLPYIYHWNAAVTHSFFGSLATEIKYMGNHGVHQPLASILNDSSPVSAVSNLPVFITNPGLATLNALPISLFGLANTPTAFTAAGFTNPISTVRQDGTSWYNAASLKITERFAFGTQVFAQYTYADTRADSTGTPLDLAFGRRMEQAPWGVKHRATVSPVFDIASMLPNSKGWVRNIVANLSIMGTVAYSRGARVPLSSGLDTSMDGNRFGSGVFVNPLSLSGTGTGVSPLTNSAGQTVAFLATDPTAQFISGAPGTFSSERPTVRLGDTRNVDMSIVKRFSFPDRMKIEVRGDVYNLFNNAQFTGLPISTLGTGTGFGITPTFLNVVNPEFNNIRGTLSGNPRSVQLALRVIF